MVDCGCDSAMLSVGCDFASEISDAASRSAAFSSAMIGRATLAATSLRFAKLSGRLLHAGEPKVTGGTMEVAAEFTVGLVGAAANDVPAPAVAAFATSFLLDQAGDAAGSALARAVELFAAPPLPLASLRSASNSSSGA